MAKLTLQEYRDTIRSVIDLDELTLNDTLVDLFVTQGMRYAQRWNQGLWPSYGHTWTVTLTSGTRDYTYDTLEVGDASSYTIAHVRDVRSDDRNSFVYLSRPDFDGQVARDSTASGSPYVWSPRDSDTIRFYPEPNAAIAVDIFGYREGTNWVALGTESDLPEMFDDAILAYALGKAYAQQDEGQTSIFWLQMADVHLTQLEDMFDQPPPVDMVMNGRPISLWSAETPGRLPYDFEI
jgi:hypothetical protein